jgi:hypothetical protein
MNKTMYLGAVALSVLTGPPALADEAAGGLGGDRMGRVLGFSHPGLGPGPLCDVGDQGVAE